MPEGAMPVSTRLRHDLLWKDLTLLTLLCAVVYGIGLTSVGVWTWQEGVRLATAQDMQRHHEWIVPTIDGQPYLAKPPLVYWCQLGLAKAMGQSVSLLHLRLTVAMMGWVSVLLTYLAARSLFSERAGMDARRARDIAWWGSLFLATGILHVRMARTGAVDIAATPFVIAAVWASTLAWRDTESRHVRWGLVTIACASVALASLVKGPPTLLAVMCPILGGIVGYAGAVRPARLTPARALIPLTLFLGVILLGVRSVDEARGVAGLVLLSGGFAWIGLHLARVSTRNSLRMILRACWRSQVLLLVSVSFGSLWIWLRLVAGRISTEAVAKASQSEISENLNIFQPEAAVRLLEASSYGAGLGSIWAIVGAAVLIQRRERVSPATAVVTSWVAVSMVAFASLSSGNGRYVTSMWPGVALLGAIGLTHALNHWRTSWLLPATYAAILILAIGQTWWYAAGRVNVGSRTTSRLFLQQVLDIEGTSPTRIASFGFWNGGLDSYAGAHVHAVLRDGVGF
ncbi:MAG TPA: phospholipid carrier-dependent glycosyltransferase, partial [Phycisphaerales bacterium]|nr:phospholipid carrier-dependent glycosyltransferase [Phycisphaerales bacterium]